MQINFIPSFLTKLKSKKSVFFRNRILNRIFKELPLLLMTSKQWEEETKAFYKTEYIKDPIYVSNQLMSWESRCIEEFFPSPPASVLVFAAGTGREMFALQQKGYKVFGMDISSGAIHEANNRCSSDLLLGTAVGSFDDYLNDKINLPQTNFDAIVVGWISISHFPSERSLVKFFRKLHSYYPNIPILISWFRIEPKSKLISAYWNTRKILPIFRSLFPAHDLPKIGPVRVISHKSLYNLMKKLNFRIVASGGQYGNDTPHMIIKAEP